MGFMEFDEKRHYESWAIFFPKFQEPTWMKKSYLIN